MSVEWSVGGFAFIGMLGVLFGVPIYGFLKGPSRLLPRKVGMLGGAPGIAFWILLVVGLLGRPRADTGLLLALAAGWVICCIGFAFSVVEPSLRARVLATSCLVVAGPLIAAVALVALVLVFRIGGRGWASQVMRRTSKWSEKRSRPRRGRGSDPR